MNKCMFIGNLVDDPHSTEIIAGNKTTQVVNFKLIVTRKFKKSNGETGKDTTIVKCNAWDSGADVISNIFAKGDKVFVEGSLQNETWDTPHGDKRSKDKVRVSYFELLKKKSDKTT